MAEQNNVTIVAEFTEGNESASQFRRKSYKRPDWETVLQGLKDGRWRVVLLPAWDRGSREGIVGVAEIIAHMPKDKRGLPVGLILTGNHGAIDLRTSHGRTLATIISEQAAAYSEAVSEKGLIARAREAAEGKYPRFGNRQFTRTAEGDIVPEEAKLLREAAQRVLPPKRESLYSICNDWNARGIPTPTGGQWERSVLRKCLLSPVNAGIRLHNSVTHEGAWDPIWDIDYLADIEAAIAEKREKHTTTARYPLALVPSTIIRCAVCKRGMRTATNGRLRRYQCLRQPGTPNCGSVSIALGPLETHLTEWLLYPTKWGIDLPTPGELQPLPGRTIKEIEAEIKDQEESERDLTRGRYIRKDVAPKVFLELRQEIEDTKAHLEAERKAILSQQPADESLIPPADDPASWWDAKSPEERRIVAEAAFAAVIIEPASRRGPGIDTDRVEICWDPAWMEALRARVAVWKEEALRGKRPPVRKFEKRSKQR